MTLLNSMDNFKIRIPNLSERMFIGTAIINGCVSGFLMGSNVALIGALCGVNAVVYCVTEPIIKRLGNSLGNYIGQKNEVCISPFLYSSSIQLIVGVAFSELGLCSFPLTTTRIAFVIAGIFSGSILNHQLHDDIQDTKKLNWKQFVITATIEGAIVGAVFDLNIIALAAINGSSSLAIRKGKEFFSVAQVRFDRIFKGRSKEVGDIYKNYIAASLAVGILHLGGALVVPKVISKVALAAFFAGVGCIKY